MQMYRPLPKISNVQGQTIFPGVGMYRDRHYSIRSVQQECIGTKVERQRIGNVQGQTLNQSMNVQGQTLLEIRNVQGTHNFQRVGM